MAAGRPGTMENCAQKAGIVMAGVMESGRYTMGKARCGSEGASQTIFKSVSGMNLMSSVPASAPLTTRRATPLMKTRRHLNKMTDYKKLYKIFGTLWTPHLP